MRGKCDVVFYVCIWKVDDGGEVIGLMIMCVEDCEGGEGVEGVVGVSDVVGIDVVGEECVGW